MFKEVVGYSFKLLLRDKGTLFWSLFFPIILGTLFHFAFANLLSDESFEEISIAVVGDQNEENIFEQVNLFQIEEATEAEAKKLLEAEKISGYVLLEEEPVLVVKQSGYAQTVIKAYMDSYDRIKGTVMNIMEASQGNADPEEIVELLQVGGHTEVKETKQAFPDYTTNYFFTLMAMACMYGAMAGVRISKIVQANQASVAARINLAPVSKIKLFFGSYLPVVFLQVIFISILYLYVRYGLKVDFGTETAGIWITNIISAVVGVTIGTAVGLCVKGSNGIKDAVVMVISMLGCFLAGMMDVQMKYRVQENAPILAKLNPSNLITDAYYSLYYYDGYDRFISNMIGLIVLSGLCFIIIFISLRRQRYESI